MPSNARTHEFGKIAPGIEYIDRPGAYALIYRVTSEIAVVSTPRGYFLPGGGQETDETQAETIKRECLEECGLHVQVGNHFANADQLIFTQGSKVGWRKRCAFFLAEIVGKPVTKTEADHTLLWLKPEEASAQLKHESQRWAVAESQRQRST